MTLELPTPEEYTPYLFLGMLSSEKSPNGNMVGYTSMAIAILCFVKQYGPTLGRMNGALVDHIQGARVYTDISRTQECQVDDYICALGADLPFALSFTTAGPPIDWWHFTGIWPHAKHSAMRVLSPLERFIWGVSVVICISKSFEVQDSWMETAMMVIAYERGMSPSWFESLCVRLWKFKLRAEKMTLSQIWVAYSGDVAHPLTKLYAALDQMWGIS